jgi:predicted lipid-binding transport protein (Tim44 family)
MIYILVLAVIALVVVMRLYSVLGRRVGSERPEARPAPASAEVGQQGAPAAPVPAPAPYTGAASGGVADIVRADPSFDVAHFLMGARKAYEMIVQAFASGDRDTLRPLLTERVFASYEKAIADREAAGGKGPELVRLRTADLADAELDGDVARLAVRFEAELAEGLHGLRDTKERWTFERDVSSRNPNWRLAGVAQA